MPTKYIEEIELSNGLIKAAVKIEKQDFWGIIDEEGKEVTPFQYEEIIDFFEGYADVKKDGLWGFVDDEGKEVVPCRYKEVYLFREGYAEVLKDGFWGLVNEAGDEVVPCRYEDIYFDDDFECYFVDGYAGVKKGGL